MKKFFIPLLLVIAMLSACNKNNNIEVLPDYSSQYMPASKVTKQAIPKENNFEEIITKEFLEIIGKINDETKHKYSLFPVGYDLFINEYGTIDKIAKIKAIDIFPKGEYIFNNDNLLIDKITKEILPKMKEWKFTPAKLFDKNVGMQKEIKALFAVGENNKIEVRKPFNLYFDNFNNYFVAVEKMPEPIGGIRAIQQNIVYPEIAKRAGIEGRVYVKAYVDSTGAVAKTEIIRGIGAGCNEVAEAAVKKIKFIPGRQRGKAVNVQVTVPILFKLNGDEAKTNK